MKGRAFYQQEDLHLGLMRCMQLKASTMEVVFPFLHEIILKSIVCCIFHLCFPCSKRWPNVDMVTDADHGTRGSIAFLQAFVIMFFITADEKNKEFQSRSMTWP